MNEEEKEAIEIVKEIRKSDLMSAEFDIEELYNAIQTTLNLISKLQKELDKKDKVIKQLEEDISNMYDEKVVRNILEDECGLSKFEIDEILNLEVEEENE